MKSSDMLKQPEDGRYVLRGSADDLKVISMPGVPPPYFMGLQVWSKLTIYPHSVEPRDGVPDAGSWEFWVDVLCAMPVMTANSDGDLYAGLHLRFWEPWNLGGRHAWLVVAKESPHRHPLYPEALGLYRSEAGRVRIPSDEDRAKASERMKRLWADPEYVGKQGRARAIRRWRLGVSSKPRKRKYRFGRSRSRSR